MSAARVAIVIPIHRHSVLASEAIASALALEGGPDYAVVAVDDGCPNAETRTALEGWAATHPGRFHRLHQANRGLSAARNAGVGYALTRFAELEAVYLLDADNRLDPHAMALFGRLLAAHPEADWFYPNFDMFGLDSHAHNGGAFSPALLAESNFCEAGSLIRIGLFEAGIWFDERLRHGYEDWDFWLSAVREGFRGLPVRQAFFRYRKRPESMLAGSHELDERLRERIRARHGWLFGRDGVSRLAAEECPRFVVLIQDGSGLADEALVFTDPRRATTRPVRELIGEFLAAHVRPAEVWRSAVWVVARSGLLDALVDRRLAHSALWHLTAALKVNDIAALRLGPSPDGLTRIEAARPDPHPPPVKRRKKLNRDVAKEKRDRARARAAEVEHRDSADLLAVGTAFLERLVFYMGKRRDRVEPSAASTLEAAPVGAVSARLPGHAPRPGGSLLPSIETLTRKIRDDPRNTTYLAALGRWREDPKAVKPAWQDYLLRQQGFGHHPWPLEGPREGMHIGFVVPIFQFGGVEKCAVALAAALRRRGVHCHLFVYGADGMAGDDWLLEGFETVHQIVDEALRDWSGPQYLGTNMAGDPGEDFVRRMMAPLSGMDAVVVTGCAAFFHGLSLLRGKGVAVVSWEHLLETGGYGRAYGTPYLAVAYEGGLDLILTCSQKLAHWLHGQGVPSAKLLALPNGPGFPMPAADVEAALAARASRGPDARLRAGFLGRLDSQKGADRFIEIARACRDLPIDFSITGKAVLGDGRLAVPGWVETHPPAYGIDELAAAFARIDVLLMPSRDEGLPLTIMEAQRVGVVPVATDVGAVSEAITDGETGFLIRPDAAVAEMTALLARLARDPGGIARVSGRAAAPVGRWDDNAGRLLAALEGLQTVAAGRRSAPMKRESRLAASSSTASAAAKDSRI